MTNPSEASDYQAFLNAKAEKFKTSQKLIEEVVEEATQAKTKAIERLIHGEVNEVYTIVTEDGQSLILRIAHTTGERLAKEHWAIKQSAKAGVPVPQILYLTTKITEDGPRSFCLQDKIDGAPLDHLNDADAETKRSIIIEAGSLLHRIHSVSTQGYGIIDDKGVGEFATIQESLTEWSRASERLFEIARAIHVSEDDIKTGLNILEDIARSYNYTDSRLLHQDYSPKHFLIKNNHINGIIDFENAKAGDPIEEFARWHYYFNDEYPLDWLLEGYPDKSRIKLPDFEKLLHAWRINFGFGVMDYYESDNNAGGFKHAKAELTKDLKYFA
jgi:aminoglycoside phosphotransferase (APT) family kinase protein